MKHRKMRKRWYQLFRTLPTTTDALFVFKHAPGSSAYNKVERRMAPLSKFTAEIIFPFDTFGSHLDSSNKTVDEELE